MLAVVFETVQVLVAFAADLTAVRLLLLHTNGTGIGNGCGGVYNGECTIGVLLELLILMTVLEAD